MNSYPNFNIFIVICKKSILFFLIILTVLDAQEIQKANDVSKNILTSVIFSEIVLNDDSMIIKEFGFSGKNLISAKSIFTPEIGELIRDKSLDESCFPNLNVQFHVKNIEKGVKIVNIRAVDFGTNQEILQTVVISRDEILCNISNEIKKIYEYINTKDDCRILFTVSSVQTHDSPYIGSQTWFLSRNDSGKNKVFVLPIKRAYGCFVKISTGICFDEKTYPAKLYVRDDYSKTFDGIRIGNYSSMRYDQQYKASIQNEGVNKTTETVSFFAYQNIQYEIECKHPGFNKYSNKKFIILNESECKTATMPLMFDCIYPSKLEIAKFNIDCSKSKIQETFKITDTIRLWTTIKENPLYEDNRTWKVNALVRDPETGNGEFCFSQFDPKSNILTIQVLGDWSSERESQIGDKNNKMLELISSKIEKSIIGVSFYNDAASPRTYYSFYIRKKNDLSNGGSPKIITHYKKINDQVTVLESNIEKDSIWELVDIPKSVQKSK